MAKRGPKHKKKGKHLQFYMDCMDNGHLPYDGLCKCADKKCIRNSLLSKFKPRGEELCILQDKGLIPYGNTNSYWGAGILTKAAWRDRTYKFTPLRQTIVLFMAAINNEL